MRGEQLRRALGLDGYEAVPLASGSWSDITAVTVDGEPATIAPATTLPLAQLHYLA